MTGTRRSTTTATSRPSPNLSRSSDSETRYWHGTMTTASPRLSRAMAGLRLPRNLGWTRYRSCSLTT
nr:MAG TPA: hypothetical protein [Caudoviricetes sp.]